MRPRSAFFLGATLGVTSANKLYSETIGIGQIRQHDFNESNLNDLRRPNATNSVNFTIGGEEWTWRVNVTSFSVPDAMLSLDEPDKRLPDPRIIMTTSDLQWPRTNETLNETAIRFNEHSSASDRADPICMSVLTSPIWPNVTNELQDQSSGGCEAALGQECLRAILMESTTDSQGGCTNPSLLMPVCQEALGVIPRTQLASGISGGFYHDRDNFTSYYSETAAREMNTSYLEQSYSGEGVHFQYGKVSPEGNETALLQAESMFRMMVLTLPGGSKSAVCMRVNTSIDDVDVSDIAQRANWNDEQSGNGNGNENENPSSSGDDGNEDDASAASPQHAAAVGTLGLTVFAVAAFGLL